MEMRKRLSLFLLMLASTNGMWASVPNSVIGVIDNPATAFISPRGVAFTPDGTVAYVANYFGTSVSIVDVATNTVTGTVTDLSPATFAGVVNIAVTADGTRAYTANNGSPGGVSVIDLITNEVVALVIDNAGTFNQPFGITISGNYAYVTNQLNNSVSIIDILPTSITYNQVVASVAVGAWPESIAISGTTAYVVNANLQNNGGGSVSILDISDPLNIPAPTLVTDASTTFNNPYGIAISGNYAYVTNSYNNQLGGSVSIVDISTPLSANVVGIVTDTNNTFNSPNGIVITGTTAYVSNYNGNSVSIINITTPLSATVSGTADNSNLSSPYSIAITDDGNKVYIPNIGNNTVSILDTDSSSASFNDITGVVINFGFNQPQAMAITADGTTGYVLNYVGFINVVDIATNTVTGIVTDVDSTFNQPTAMAITPDGTKGYVANDAGSSVSIVDIATNAVTGLVDDLLVNFDNPVSVVFTADGATAYIVNYSDDSVAIVDVVTDAVIGIVDDADYPFFRPSAIAITPDGTKAYVTNYDSEEEDSYVVIIDLVPSSSSYNDVIGLVIDSEGTFNNPTALAITADGLTAYVVNYDGNSVSIINLATDSVTGTVLDSSIAPTFSQPKNIALTPNGKIGYVANFYSQPAGNSISIINLATNKVTGTIVDASLYGPSFVMMTQNGQFAYVADYYSNQVSIIFIDSIIQPVTSLKVRSIANDFITYIARQNIVTWAPASGGIQAIKYMIYRDANLTQYVGTVFAHQPLEFIDYNRQPNTTYSYYLVAIDADNNISTPVSATITTQGK